MLTKPAAIAMFFCSTLALTSANADAAVHHSRCDGMGFAHIDGNWVSDPVCEAELAARIARKSGFHYSAAQLYRNPAAMDEFCRGEANIELTTACAPYND